MPATADTPVPPRDYDHIARRETIGISLIGSEEARAAVEMVRDEFPDATIQDNDCYFKIEREGGLTFDMGRLGERLGHDLDVHDFLVNMTSYYGRIVVNDGVVEIHSDIQPDRFKSN